jgi:BirA family biotin operon repressor/biotin-[acetyl-CoA-carboxylase] ligase
MEAGANELSSDEMVLGLLAEGGDEFTSGEMISVKLGITRAQVFKHIESLRGRGYRIDALPMRGYRLAGVPDRLTELEVGPLLTTHDLGHPLHWFEEIGSTNDEALRIANEGALHGECVIAEAQSAGRGRRGRHWMSPPGQNLYLSLVLRPEVTPPRAPEITIVASVAVCEAVQAAGVEGAQIKWPNDVVVRGKKLAGILTEMVSEEDRVKHVVVGMGVNLNMAASELPAALRDIATSVQAETGEKVPRALFAAALLSRFEEWLDRHAEEGFEPVRERWRELSSTLGKPVRAGGVEGVAEDMDEHGALIVRTEKGEVAINAGDVEEVEA